MKKNSKPMKVYPDDEICLRMIASERYLRRLDKQLLSPARLLKATLRIPKVKEVLLKAKIDKDAI